jgi:translocation and assembly module TamB
MAEPSAPLRRSFWWRALATGGLSLVFTGALGAGALLHVGLAPTRRMASALLTDLLSRTFTGRVVIERIGHIDADGFDDATANVYDPEGRRVLAVTGLRGHSSLLRLARTLIRGGDIDIVIPHARVEHAEVEIVSDEQGAISLARAFTPRPPKAARSPATTPTRVRVWLPDAQVGVAHVHGGIAGLHDVEVDLARVQGSVLAGNDRTSIKVERYSLNAHGLVPSTLQGTSATYLDMPSSTGKKLSVWATFDGFLGDVQVAARAGLDGSDLDLAADIPKARPESVRELLPAWPIFDDAGVHVEAKGPPAGLAVKGDATVGAGRASFSGDLSLEGGVTTKLAVNARNVDLRSLAQAAPSANLSASGQVNLAVHDGAVDGSAELETGAFRIDPIDVPPASVTAKLHGGAVSGRASLHDPALTSEIDYDVHRGDGGDAIVGIDWTARAPEIARIPWLAKVGNGQARWHAKGQIARGALDARIDASVAGFQRPRVALEQANITGSLRGPIAHPGVSASLKGQKLAAGPLFFPNVQATAEGALTRPTIAVTGSGEHATTLSAKAAIEPRAGGAKLGGIEFRAEREGIALAGKVGSIEVGGDRVRLEGVAVEGAGGPIRGSFAVSESSLHAQLSSPGTDLKKLGKVLLPGIPVEGLLSFDIDADLAGKSEKGHARVILDGGSLAGLSGVHAEAEASVDERHFTGGADVRVGELGSITASATDAELGGPMLRGSSWLAASGKLQVESTVVLDQLRQQVPIAMAFLSDAGGTLRSRLIVGREDLETHRAHATAASELPPPDLDLVVWSDHLHAAIRGEGKIIGTSPPAFVTENVDVQVGLHVEGETQRSQLTARLVDAQGMLVGLTALGQLPVREIWQTPQKAVSKLADLPITAQLTLPRRSLEDYPEMLRPPGVNGELEAAGRFTGSVRAPAATLNLRGYGIQPSSSALALPVDLDVEGKYDGEKLEARLYAKRPQGVVLDAVTQIKVALKDLLAPKEARPATWWEANGAAHLLGFPLGSLPALADNQVAGLANGTLTFTGINRDPVIGGQVDLTQLTIDKASFPRGVALLRVAQGGLLASAKLDQASGGASVTANARLGWLSAIAPEIDTDEPLDLYVEAHDFRAAALYPLIFRGIFTYFDGKLNGTLHLHQEKQKAERVQTVDGNFDLDDGVFQIPQIGQEFTQAKAHLLVTRTGEVQVNDVSANGATGRLSASGTMLLKGFSFASAEGTVKVAEKESIPLTFEGVSLGQAWGTLALHAKKADDHTIKLDIDVPTFHTDLPESSSRAVEALADHPDIKVGVRSSEGELTTVALGAEQEKRSQDALAWHVTGFLGQDVQIKRGTGITMWLTGEPVIDLTDEAHVSGYLNLRSGAVEVFGKPFEIEHGSVKFDNDEPGNPLVTVTARWDAPNGMRIYADFAGHLKDKDPLRFRSEPQLPQEKILMVLLLGADVIDNSSQQSSQGKDLLVAGGGVAAMKLNQALSKVTPGVSTRVATDEQSPTPEVAIQLGPKVTAQVSYRTKAPTPGEQPDRVLLTVDWNFRHNWSIGTTVGDRGSSVLDLIWQYRY